jgi:hypothetical protein
MYENYRYRADFSFELRISKVFKLTRYMCMNFSSFGPKLKQKFELSQNFELTRFTVLAQKYHCNKPENHHEQSMGLTLLD